MTKPKSRNCLEIYFIITNTPGFPTRLVPHYGAGFCGVRVPRS